MGGLPQIFATIVRRGKPIFVCIRPLQCLALTAFKPAPAHFPELTVFFVLKRLLTLRLIYHILYSRSQKERWREAFSFPLFLLPAHP